MATGNAVRVFDDAPAVRDQSPLIIGITGASSSGKTYSGLRLATGIQRVIGGDIFGIDTESSRMKHYADYFTFRHVPFKAPYGPLDYVAAIDHCASKGARIVLIDSMTHEHDGEGGVLDQIEDFLQEKCGDDWSKRQSMNFVAQVRPKRARKKLNQRIVQLGHIVFILCYRAEEKVKPRKKGDERNDGNEKSNEPELLGWQPTTTSKLPYDMTVRFLLTPGCEGVPLLMPPNPAEKMLVKSPKQFKDWFTPGDALSEDMGDRLASWAAGKSPPKALAAADYDLCADRVTFDALEAKRASVWKAMPPGEQKTALKKASDAARERLNNAGIGHDTISQVAALRACDTEADRARVWERICAMHTGAIPVDVDAVNTEVKERFAL